MSRSNVFLALVKIIIEKKYIFEMNMAEFLLEILPVRGVKYACLFFILPPSFFTPYFCSCCYYFKKNCVCVCVCVCVSWRKAGVNGKEEDKLN